MANALSPDELEFVHAIEQYRKANAKTFLSWSEVLGIFKELGYRKSERNRQRTPRKVEEQA